MLYDVSYGADIMTEVVTTTPYTSDDFGHSPFVLFYEITRACDSCVSTAGPARSRTGIRAN